jgi:hypothetical protein
MDCVQFEELISDYLDCGLAHPSAFEPVSPALAAERPPRTLHQACPQGHAAAVRRPAGDHPLPRGAAARWRGWGRAAGSVGVDGRTSGRAAGGHGGRDVVGGKGRLNFLYSILIISQDDQLVSQEERHRAIDSVKDVRLLDSDHFILWRQPEALSQAVLEALPHSWARADE